MAILDSRIDFGLRSEDYASYRPGFPASLYEQIERHTPIGGADCLDVATGPAIVARELAGRGARVVGLDISDGQVKAARDIMAQAGLDGRFLVSTAEATGLASERFDLVVCGQAWHWLNPERALVELARVLRPGGFLFVAHFDYLPQKSRIAERTEALVLEHNPGWDRAGSSGTYAHEIDEVHRGPMRFVEQRCWDHEQPFTHREWRGRVRTCNGVGSSGVMDDAAVTRFDSALSAMLAEEFPGDRLVVDHRVWLVVAQKGQS